MKHVLPATVFFASLAFLSSPTPLEAQTQTRVPWSQICAATADHQITVTTANGDIVSGYCVSVRPDTLSVRTGDKRVVTVVRTAFARLQMRRVRGHSLSSLGKGMNNSFRFSAKALFSPLAPLGIVALPGTIAWGAIAAPFCLMGDLGALASDLKEIPVS